MVPPPSPDASTDPPYVWQLQLDSILGATLQETLYSKKRNLVVHSRRVVDDEDKVVKVNGLNVLSNNGVSRLL